MAQLRPRLNTDRFLKTLLWMAAALALIAGGYYAGKVLLNMRQQAIEARIAAEQEEVIAAIEDEWGIRVTKIAVTAMGGLIDLRYQITDPDKAIFLFDDAANIPRIIAKDGTEIYLNDIPHTHDLHFGVTYFFIMRNAKGAIEPGDYVTVVVGKHEIKNFKVLEQ